MKKIFFILAALCCMMVAKAQTQPDNEIWYTSSDNKVVTPSNDNFNVSIVSNDYNDGKGVIKFSGELTSIGEFAFNAKTTLVSVTIPALVTSIGDEAFNYCTSLESLTFAEGSHLENIGEGAFYLTGIKGELTLVASLKNIGLLAFAGCQLTKVYMSSEDLSGISNKIFIESAVIIVPSALYEAYKNHFSGNNKVEVPLNEWKEYAIAKIDAAMQTVNTLSDTDRNTITTGISTIENATTFDGTLEAYYAVLALIDQQKTFEDRVRSVLEEWGTKQPGTAIEIEIEGEDGKTIQLYKIKKVKFIKVDEE